MKGRIPIYWIPNFELKFKKNLQIFPFVKLDFGLYYLQLSIYTILEKLNELVLVYFGCKISCVK